MRERERARDRKRARDREPRKPILLYGSKTVLSRNFPGDSKKPVSAFIRLGYQYHSVIRHNEAQIPQRWSKLSRDAQI